MQHFLHNHRLQKWFELQAEQQFANKQQVEVNGKTHSFSSPTLLYNLVYQLVHLYNHLTHEGIGLRQLVDYYILYRAAQQQNIDIAKLPPLLQKFGLYHFTCAVMWTLCQVFQLPQEQMIVPMNARLGKLMLNEMLLGGNFGKYDGRIASWQQETAVGRNIQRLHRDLHLWWYYPSEAVSEPFFRVWHYFWRLRHQ